MALNPAIVIPTFWTSGSGRRAASDRTVGHVFDHPTDLNDPDPQLARCLKSLQSVPGVGRIILVIGTTDPAIDERADQRVSEIVDGFPELDIFVVGAPEVGSIHRRLAQLDLGGVNPSLYPEGYGAVRNIGLIAAAVFGHDSVVFLDDDELVEGQEFFETALFGLGRPLHTGGFLYAKTGIPVDALGSWMRKPFGGWTDVFWRIAETYNEAMAGVLQPPRLQKARFAFGGALAIHREMYTRIAFDPWIPRGEDTDYVINVMMHGGEVYFDDQWRVTNLPSQQRSRANRFRHNVAAFIYERRKLEFAKSQVDLRQVHPHMLDPYPGNFLDASLTIRAFLTGALRALAGIERKEHWDAALHAVQDAGKYATENCTNYFALQRAWPHLMETIWEDVPLRAIFTGERAVERATHTEQFGAV